MSSLRRRLLMGTAIGTASILLLSGTALYALTRASLLREFDNGLRGKAATLAAMIEQDGDRVEMEFAEADMHEFDRPDRPEYLQVWLADGTVIERSPSLNGRDLPRFTHSTEQPTVHDLDLPDGRPGRIVLQQVTARRDHESAAAAPRDLVLALARDTLEVRSALLHLRVALVSIGVVATVVSVGVLALLVNAGLKPVDRLAKQIAGIDERRLATRIEPARSPRELQPIVSRLNELLERLDAAFLREKTLTADVAHELRTPLAGLRSVLEVALSRERDGAAYRRSLTECAQVCAQTQRLVENLLALARLDAGAEPTRRQPTDLASLLREAWTPFEPAASEKRLDVTWSVEEMPGADTDPDKLRRVLSNVFENAVHYVDDGGSVLVQGAQVNGTFRLSVTNSGHCLSDDDVARVFDRFWRGDAGRPSDGTHCGLGLAVCRSLVDSLGGTITADLPDGGRFRVTVIV